MINEKYLIQYRNFVPHYLPDSQEKWEMNPNRQMNKETASEFAKSGHRRCNGKGWLEYGNPGGLEFVVFCDCAIKNYKLLSELVNRTNK